MNKQELKQLALDIMENKVFGSWMIHPNESESLIGSIFTPLIFLNQEQLEKLKNQKPAHFYEYMDKAGPRTINGYPIFMSFRSLTKEESIKLAKFLESLKKLKTEFMKEDK